jgi:hypothetical protein
MLSLKGTRLFESAKGQEKRYSWQASLSDFPTNVKKLFKSSDDYSTGRSWK